MTTPLLTYFGILRSVTSWAKVCRELVAALVSRGADINVYERKGFLYDGSFPLDHTIKAKISNQFKGNIVFTFENPRVYHYLPPRSFSIGFLVYEFTSLPSLWVERIDRYLDRVVVPSEFCRKVFTDSGVSSEKIKVLRHGFNPAYYYPARRKKNAGREFTFLCVANPHKREGIDLLADSFARAFPGRENVRLVLKLSYLPGKNAKSFEDGSLGRLAGTWSGRRGNPRIQIIDGVLNEKEMGDLYRSAHCYVSLSRAEGFGMCLLEALACGVPVITPGWGGQADFLSAKNAFFIGYRLARARGEEYENTEGENYLAWPDAVHAAGLMREIFLRREDRVFRKQLLLPSARYFWWATIAEEFLEWIQDTVVR